MLIQFLVRIPAKSVWPLESWRARREPTPIAWTSASTTSQSVLQIDAAATNPRQLDYISCLRYYPTTLYYYYLVLFTLLCIATAPQPIAQ